MYERHPKHHWPPRILQRTQSSMQRLRRPARVRRSYPLISFPYTLFATKAAVRSFTVHSVATVLLTPAAR